MKVRPEIRLVRLLSVLLIVVSASACASARISQFDKFALAGIKFTDSLPPVLDDSFRVAVETDSRILIETRRILSSEEDRLREIEASNENLGRRVTLLNDLKQHVRLLRSYFIAMMTLAKTDEASGISDAAEGIVASLGALDGRISAASIGGLSVEEFIGQSASVAVSNFQSAALNRELRAHASAIDRELDILQAALTVLGSAMRADLEAQLAATERDEVIMPYVKSGTLPSDWNARRLEYFKRQLDISSVDSAADAARNLRLSFVALVENRLDDAGIALLLQDIDRVIIFAERIGDTP